MTLPEDFNWKYYISNYKDLQNAKINTQKKAINHYMVFGKNEGRVYNRLLTNNIFHNDYVMHPKSYIVKKSQIYNFESTLHDTIIFTQDAAAISPQDYAYARLFIVSMHNKSTLENTSNVYYVTISNYDLTQLRKQYHIDFFVAIIQDPLWVGPIKNIRNCTLNNAPTISVIMLAYNNLDQSKRCLDGLLKNTKYSSYELIIVDNNSHDGSKEYFSNYVNHPNTTVILNNENSGFSGGNNLGIQHAKGDYIVLLNNDTYPLDGWLIELVNVLINNSHVGIVCPTTNSINNEAKMFVNFESINDLSNKINTYWGRADKFVKLMHMCAFFCVAIKRSLWDKIGYLDEKYGIGYFEDDDYCFRIRRAGYHCAFTNASFVYHQGSVTMKKIKKSPRIALFNKNKEYFETKWSTKFQVPKTDKSYHL
jgi:GT2 family glycosyltransferase